MAIMKTANTRRYAGRIEKPSALPSRPKSGGANVEPTYAPAICMPMIAPGAFRTEVCGCGVDDAGIDRRAAEPHHDKGGNGGGMRMYRERERRDAAEKHARAKADHFPVAETVGSKAAHEPPAVMPI